MKLRLTETQVETAKASELRLSSEATQLRTELARQGALLDSVQRIEASLSARSEEMKEKLTEDCLQLQQTLSTERSKHSLELENLNSRMRELEMDLKSAEAKKDEALTSVIEAKKEGLTTAKEVQQLTSKCSGLEAQLRSARRKLGIDDTESENTEVALEAKVLALTTDLEATREELATAKERATTYQKLAKSNESALSDLTKVTNEFKRSHKDDLNALDISLKEAKREIDTKQQLIIQLTEDLANIHGEQEKVVADLNGKIATLEAEAESLKTDAEDADSRVTQMNAEVAKYRAEATAAQVRTFACLFFSFKVDLYFSNIIALSCRTTMKESSICTLLLVLHFVTLEKKRTRRFFFDAKWKSSSNWSATKSRKSESFGMRRRRRWI
jgi:nucleoprotein TPR